MPDTAQLLLGARHRVSSFYVRSGGGGYNCCEIGWVWRASVDEPRFFGVYTRNGYIFEYDFGAAPRGTNHSYSIRNVTGTSGWIWYVDGVRKMTVGLLFTNGYSCASSERMELKESNYSHFWSLSKRNSTGTWYSWSNLSVLSDNDPNYYLNKISNTECYVQQ